MRNDVAVLEPSELLCQCLGGLAGQLAIQPLEQNLSVSFLRLLGLLGWHLGKSDDFLSLAEQLLAIDCVDGLQRVQPKIALLFLGPVTLDAVLLKERLDIRLELLLD